MPNVHIEHLEDLVFQGKSGVEKAIEVVEGVTDRLLGNTNKFDINIKFDGSPSIVMGTNPENGKYFVGTKSVFSKKVPKICYSVDDVDKYYKDGSFELYYILIKALQHVKKLGIKNILQGDVMFADTILNRNRINNKECLTFKTNLITYGIPLDSNEDMLSSSLGIAFHTEYTGDTMQTLNHSFTPNLQGLNLKSNKIWIFEPSFLGSSRKYIDDTFEIPIGEFKEQLTHLSRDIEDGHLFDDLVKETKLINLIKLFQNHMVRKGFAHMEPSLWLNEFISFGEQHIIDRNLTETHHNKNMRYFSDSIEKYRGLLIDLFGIQWMLVLIKQTLLLLLDQHKPMGTYLDTGKKLIDITNEGFVVVNTETNEIVKLVDRLSFSRMNFLRR